MTIIQGLELGYVVATTYAADLSVINQPTPPFKIGHSWFVVEQVPAPAEAS